MMDRLRARLVEVDRGFTSPCLVMPSGLSHDGYGRIGSGGRRGPMVYAHVAVWREAHGELPDGLQLDHLCRQRDCARLDHLEAVTPRQNVLRGDTIPARRAAQTHCIHGHPFDRANTYVERHPDGRFRGRKCRTCARVRQRRRGQRIRDEG